MIPNVDYAWKWKWNDSEVSIKLMDPVCCFDYIYFKSHEVGRIGRPGDNITIEH